MLLQYATCKYVLCKSFCWFQDGERSQDQLPVEAPGSSRLDSTTMLQLLQQQRNVSQAQGSSEQADRVSVGCQTRQGDSWRVQSEACLGKSGEESGSWAQHGNSLLVITLCLTLQNCVQDLVKTTLTVYISYGIGKGLQLICVACV